MPIQEKTTVFVFNACHADKAAAASANALHSLEVEWFVIAVWVRR